MPTCGSDFPHCRQRRVPEGPPALVGSDTNTQGRPQSLLDLEGVKSIVAKWADGQAAAPGVMCHRRQRPRPPFSPRDANTCCLWPSNLPTDDDRSLKAGPPGSALRSQRCLGSPSCAHTECPPTRRKPVFIHNHCQVSMCGNNDVLDSRGGLQPF